MVTSIHTEDDFRSYPDKLSEGLMMIHFKMVGVGPNTLAKSEYLGSNICNVVDKQPGFFLVSNDGYGLREAMHDLVDRFCDAQEGQ